MNYKHLAARCHLASHVQEKILIISCLEHLKQGKLIGEAMNILKRCEYLEESPYSAEAASTKN